MQSYGSTLYKPHYDDDDDDDSDGGGGGGGGDDDDNDDDDGDGDCDDDGDDLNRAVLFRYLHAVILYTLLQNHTLSVSQKESEVASSLHQLASHRSSRDRLAALPPTSACFQGKCRERTRVDK